MYKKIIFAGKRATCREPMAAELLKQLVDTTQIEIVARGIVVLFPEPLNQKAQVVMAAHNIKMDDYQNQQLESEDFGPDTLVLTFDARDYNKISSMEGAQNVYILTNLTGEELEVLDPYGADLVTYGICFETLQKSLEKLAEILPNLG